MPYNTQCHLPNITLPQSSTENWVFSVIKQCEHTKGRQLYKWPEDQHAWLQHLKSNRMSVYCGCVYFLFYVSIFSLVCVSNSLLHLFLPSFACLLLSFVCLFCLQCVLPIPMFLLHVLSCRALSFVSLSLVPVWSALSSLAMALCFIYLVAISLSFSFTPAFRDSPLGHMLHASLSFSCAHPTCSLFKFSLSVHFSFLSAASILSEFLFTFLPCLSWATFSVFFCICVSLLLVDFLSQHHSVALCLLVFLSSTFLLSVHFEHFISLQVCVSLVF